MTGAPEVTIAGAGALGLATALALADCGARVTVCDPGGPNASSVAAGMIAPTFEAILDAAARPHLELLLAARDLWPALAERAGIALERSGAMAVGDDLWLDRIQGIAAGLGLHPAEIPAATAQALAPGLSPVFPRALLSREDWRLEASVALAGLRAAAEAAGVAFRSRPVKGRGEADVLVVAAGLSGDFAELAPELASLSPIKGHILRVRGPAAGVVVRGERAYAVPGEGAMTIGATMEAGLADATVDPAQAARLRSAGAELFPGLAQAPFDAAVGVRAATPDGLPLVGWSRAGGIVLASGARRNGWLLAPLVAKVAAACVLGRDPGRYAAQLDPARFGRGG